MILSKTWAPSLGMKHSAFLHTQVSQHVGAAICLIRVRELKGKVRKQGRVSSMWGQEGVEDYTKLYMTVEWRWTEMCGACNNMNILNNMKH